MSSENFGLFVNDNEYYHSLSTPNHISPVISLLILMFTLPVLMYPNISLKLSMPKNH
jgi:hypothetical protein